MNIKYKLKKVLPSKSPKALALSLIKLTVIVLGFGCFLNLASQQVIANTGLEDVCSQFPDSEICQQATADPKGDKVGGTNGIFVQIINFIIYLTAIVSVLMVVFGAFKYVTSQGDANQTKSAKDTVLYALVGLFVSVNAIFIVRFIISKI